MKTKKSVKKRFWITRNRGNSCSQFFSYSLGRSNVCELASPTPLNRGRRTGNDNSHPVVSRETIHDRLSISSLTVNDNILRSHQGRARSAACQHPFYSSFYPIDPYPRNQSILARSGSAKKGNGLHPVIIKKCDKKRLLKCSPRSLWKERLLYRDKGGSRPMPRLGTRRFESSVGVFEGQNLDMSLSSLRSHPQRTCFIFRDRSQRTT